MATASKSSPTRTVVLLKPTERKRLEKLAASEQVSSGEIIRRSLHAYEQRLSPSEEEALATLIEEMNAALDAALVTIRSARSEIREDLDRIEEMRKART